VRQERYLDRELHNKAKELYITREVRNNPEFSSKPVFFNRNGLKEIKRKLIEEYPEYEPLRAKFDLIGRRTTQGKQIPLSEQLEDSEISDLSQQSLRSEMSLKPAQLSTK